MSHNIHTSKQSPSAPAPQFKNQQQAQAIATPISKHYAAPKFHHSPAPASLPPPPFLSKLFSSKDGSTEKNDVSAPVLAPASESSPLGFLFTAKERETSLLNLQSERPPRMDSIGTAARHGSNTLPKGPSLSISDLFKMNEAEKSKGVVPHPLRISSPLEDAVLQTPELPVTNKPQSVWANRPQVDSAKATASNRSAITEPEHSKQTPPTQAMTPRPSAKKKQLFDAKADTFVDAKDLEKSKIKTKPTQVSSESHKKSKKVVNTKKLLTTSPQPITPRMILKRESVSLGRNSTEEQKGKEDKNTHRESGSSSFKALKKRVQPSTLYTGVHKELPLEDSEEDLRRQASHLMDLLKLQSATPSRESSPAQHTLKQPQQTDSPSEVENDLRRLLRLSA